MSADDYSRALARVSVAQIAEVAGFEACQESAVDILGDLLLRYTSQLCGAAHDYAELASRTDVNLADVLQALSDLGTTPDELDAYARLQDYEVPFAHTVAPFPVERQAAGAPTFEDKAERAPPDVPPFFPAFPDPHTYHQTAAFQGHETDPQKQRQAVLQGKQQAEAALVRLHQRLVATAAGPKLPEANPFTAAPVVEQAGSRNTAAAAIPDAGQRQAADTSAVAGHDAGEAATAAVAAADEATNVGTSKGGMFDAAAAQRAFQRILPDADTGPASSSKPWATDDVREADGSWIGWKASAASSVEGGQSVTTAMGFSLQPGIAEQRAARALAAPKPPKDAFEERAKSVVPVGSRQRKSKYDADPKIRRAEEILGAGADAVYAGDTGMDVDEPDAM